MSNQFAIFRTKKLKTDAEIAKVGNHNDRRRKELPANVDPKRVANNRSYTADSRPLLDRVRDKLKGIKYRKDAVKAIEIVCAFSPGSEQFIPIDMWATDSLAFIRKTFGADNLISAVLHDDEKTPHLQCVVVPLIGGKLAAKRIIGSPRQLRDIQTTYHKVVEKFGLIRGTKGSSRPHLSMQEIYQGTQEGTEIIKNTLDAVPKKSPMESWKTYSEKLRKHVTTALKPLAAAKTAATLAALEVQSLRRLADESESARKAVADRLRSLNLAEVAKRLLGYEGVNDSKTIIFEDDARKIVITGNAFKDEKSSTRSERGAISLTRHILSVNYQKAVEILAQLFPDEKDAVKAEAIREAETSISIAVDRAAATELDTATIAKHLAKPALQQLPAMLEFLETISGIARKLLDMLVKEMRLWANRWGSVCFQTSDALGHKGIAIVGRTTNTIQNVGSKDAFFLIGNPAQAITFVETPIEALQYHSTTGETAVYVPIEGDFTSAFACLKQSGANKVVAAYRSDRRGAIMAKKIKEQAEKMGMTYTRQRPTRGTGKVAVPPSIKPSGIVNPESF